MLALFIEVALSHWFYEDFAREANPTLPSLPLKRFSEALFNSCPLLHRWRGDHEGAFNHFMQYKTRVPVCGAIMLNDTWDKVRAPDYMLCGILLYCLGRSCQGLEGLCGMGFPKG